MCTKILASTLDECALVSLATTVKQRLTDLSAQMVATEYTPPLPFVSPVVDPEGFLFASSAEAKSHPKCSLVHAPFQQHQIAKDVPVREAGCVCLAHPPTTTCPTHRRSTLCAVCKVCNVLVCSECLFIGEHRGHENEPLGVAFASVRQALEGHTGALRAKYQKLFELQVTTMDRDTALFRDTKKAIAALESQSREVVSQVRAIADARVGELLAQQKAACAADAEVLASVDRQADLVGGAVALVAALQSLALLVAKGKEKGEDNNKQLLFFVSNFLRWREHLCEVVERPPPAPIASPPPAIAVAPDEVSRSLAQWQQARGSPDSL
eukprot:TRINITY_DN2541_c0_g1_i1.p1 TRINITY_DN2541_c0_g1~~TRINITY_DN2541_c0_g1_i1.p1  ORF type:complete len:325 (+),score=85.43 TRINITY_DN2541_c0_g1_i1:274-1248(+)